MGVGFSLHLEVALHEEKVLSQTFGDAYGEYRNRVRRWI